VLSSHGKICSAKDLLEGTEVALSRVVAGLGVGIALAGAPGPVQAVLLEESVRGGVGRGLRALAGVHATFAAVLACLALGLSLAPPNGAALRLLQAAGGALLLWLAVDGFRTGHEAVRGSGRRRALPPEARGVLAILLNPGGWLFLGAVASPLFAAAALVGGTWQALLVAAALVGGAALGDAALVLLGGAGVRRAGDRVQRWVGRALATVLAGLGVWLLLAAAVG
jgi:threonine/homoserine/homoserine lactone efflux protein